jgi:glycosyltransferase involved in cell wall biosynthesis
VTLRVLRVSERIPPLRGGKEIHVAELTRAQVSAGHDIAVLYRFGDDSQLASPGIPVTLPPPVAALGGLAGTALFSAAAARRARRRAAPPDVVHVHGDLAEAWWMARYARQVGAAVVLTVHGGLHPRYARPSRYSFSRVDGFIAHGERVRRDLCRCGVPEDRVRVMSSGLATDLIDAARVAATREPGLIVAVGSLDAVKNIDTIIRAVLRVPDVVDVRLEVIGEGPRSDELKSLAGDSHRIRFLGQLSRPEVYRRVAAADAFVMASRRLRGKGEGVPTALLEAMALGRLSIVSTAATPSPAVTDERSYWTFDPDDPERLGQLILEAVTNRTVRQRTGERARAAVAHLDWHELARRIDDLYDRALWVHGRRR